MVRMYHGGGGCCGGSGSGDKKKPTDTTVKTDSKTQGSSTGSCGTPKDDKKGGCCG